MFLYDQNTIQDGHHSLSNLVNMKITIVNFTDSELELWLVVAE